MARKLFTSKSKRRQLQKISGVASLILPSAEFDFTAGLPDDWSIDSSGSATYRDENGEWQQNTTDAIRLHHDASGNLLGALIEPPRTNLANHPNFNVTGIGNIVAISGDGTASVVDDTSALASATIDGSTFTDVGNGSAIELTGGTAGTTFQISTTLGTGNGNTAHSFRVVARTTTTGYHGNVKTSDGKGQTNWTSDTNYDEIIAENIFPNADGRYLAAFVSAGKAVRIKAVQFEKGEEITTPIVTVSTSGLVRVDDEIFISNLDQKDYFNQDEGAIVALIKRNRKQSYDAGFFTAINDAAGNTHQLGVRAAGSTSRVDGQYIVSGSDKLTEFISPQLIDDFSIVGIKWGDDPDNIGKKRVVAFNTHGMRAQSKNNIDEIAGTLDAFYLGRVNKFFGYANQIVKNVVFFNQDVTFSDIAQAVLTSNDVGIACGGQSNMEGWTEVEGLYTGGGESAAIAELDKYFTAGRNYLSNMAIGGSAIYQRNNAGQYWLENDGETAGPLLEKAIEIHAGLYSAGGLKGFLWNQGSSDVAAENKDSLKAGWLEIFTQWRAGVAELPVIIIPPARRGDGSSGDTVYGNWHDAIYELAAAYDWIHIAPTPRDLTMLFDYAEGNTWATSTAYAYLDGVVHGGANYVCKAAHTSGASTEPGVGASWTTYWIQDDIHIADEGQALSAERVVRKVLDVAGESVSGPVDGPSISSASRSGTSVTVTLSHPIGITDFTPTTDINGFVFEDDGTPINISAAVRTNATTITLTLDSTPTGVEVLKYIYGTAFGVDRTKLVKGNDSLTLPMNPQKISVT